ncbi:hypothetical protein, partial [Streptomyces longwoodensis]|uniref:hypothetical protein n=1 Tax=Streptomyces longwoodensis TaxID=68231 RepID=UPI00224D959D
MTAVIAADINTARQTVGDTPHHLTVTTLPNGDRDFDWAHPAECANGDTCDIQRRTQRARPGEMTELADGRPDGTYRLARYGLHGLYLADDNGNALPDVAETLPPAAQAARDIAGYVIQALAEGICEDTERLQELCEIIRRGEHQDQWEGAARDAVGTIIREHLGT